MLDQEFGNAFRGYRPGEEKSLAVLQPALRSSSSWLVSSMPLAMTSSLRFYPMLMMARANASGRIPPS
jgi:hypothetical protein